MSFRNHKVWQLKFSSAWRRPDDNVAKERTKCDVNVMLVLELLKNLSAALGISTVIFNDNFNRATIDATPVIYTFNSGLCCGIIPTAIGRTDPCRVLLEANFNR